MEVLPAVIGHDTASILGQLNVLRGLTTPVHFDITDGQFVPERTPLEVLSQLDEHLTYDMHCMVADPATILPQFHNNHIRYCFVHAELSPHTLIDLFESDPPPGATWGLACNLETSLDLLDLHQHVIGAVLLMAIVPGDAGRPFDQKVVDRLRQVKDRYPDLYVGVDGGISVETMQLVKEANGVAAHSSIFGQPGHELEQLQQLQDIAARL